MDLSFLDQDDLDFDAAILAGTMVEGRSLELPGEWEPITTYADPAACGHEDSLCVGCVKGWARDWDLRTVATSELDADEM
ncbi:hypothetical protein ABZS77_29650 [Micromonospora sp. NPDC005298]|uniref:hypothetical protein n=1 Tax=Micromonospora sp. NPDC005298 TaxID=3156873 RepID=UPI0033ABEA5D